MRKNIIGFNITVGRKKPETIVNKDAACPFCEYDHLENIIARRGEMTLLENKYNVLEDSFQTVLIETRYCGSDIPDYSKAHMHELIHFGVEYWFSLLDSGRYKSVLFFKNYGPLSGGTILHPHMQIVGLRHVDSSLMYDKSDFIGMTISQTKNVELNVSTMPRLGFCELNILTKNNNELDTIADFIQITVDYIMKYFNKRCKSYNIFFYRIDGLIAVKVMPRFPTSPLFIGYNLRLRPNNLNIIVDEIQKLYFNKS